MTTIRVPAHPTASFADFVPRARGRLLLSEPGAGFHYTYNGRAAIYRFLTGLPACPGRDVVLAPAFHCPTVVTPALRAGYRVRFYDVGRDLRLDLDDVLACLDSSVAAVIVINYFGFPIEMESLAEAARSAGCYVLEDCSHSFLSVDPLQMTGKRGDAAVYSFWKLVPAMTGGGLRLNNEALRRPLDYRRIPVRASAVLMKRLLEQAINNLEDGVIKTAFNYLDRQRMGLKAAPSEPDPPENPPDDVFPFDPRLADAGIPLLSRVILHSSDLAAMVATRRRNYQAWMDGLRFGTALRPVFRSLPPSVCPWALPVILEGRRQIDLRIRSQGVPLFTFGDVLHGALYRSPPAPGLERAQFLADNLMCLPVHQNLAPAQIEGYCRIINAYLESQRISLPTGQHADHLPALAGRGSSAGPS